MRVCTVVNTYVHASLCSNVNSHRQLLRVCPSQTLGEPITRCRPCTPALSHSPKWADCSPPTLALFNGRHAVTNNEGAKLRTFQSFPNPDEQQIQLHCGKSTADFSVIFALGRTVSEKIELKETGGNLQVSVDARWTNGISTLSCVKTESLHQLISFDEPIC